jgi:hypothetical protein
MTFQNVHFYPLEGYFQGKNTRVISDLININPATVCVLADSAPDRMMQSIAAENNMSETALVVKT